MSVSGDDCCIGDGELGQFLLGIAVHPADREKAAKPFGQGLFKNRMTRCNFE